MASQAGAVQRPVAGGELNIATLQRQMMDPNPQVSQAAMQRLRELLNIPSDISPADLKRIP
jgi:hypothetical protein